MPDIKQVFSEEIRRLARKEIKQAVAPLAKVVLEQKHAIRELKHELAELKKFAPKQELPVPDAAAPDAADSAKVRLNAAGIVRIRTKLELSQSKFAALLGVSTHTVSMWEVGRVSPRTQMKREICGLRVIGKRELKKRLDALTASAEAAGRAE